MGRVLNLLGNIFWFLSGGFLSGLLWLLAAFLMLISIIGIPYSRACFEIGKLSFFPFGKDVVNKSDIEETSIIGESFGFLVNIFWFIFGGLWLFLYEIFIGALLCVTIIGIPFGIQHFKLGFIALAPVGKRVINKNDYRLESI